jgi:NadR type nicotinamide-nucleotide adenylyltransferase
MSDIIKIAITGPESTGKSLLSSQLADRYQTVFVPEFARIQLLKSNGSYTYDDILTIAKGQSESEKIFESIANHLLFCDTEMLVAKVWCEMKYGICHQWILDKLVVQNYGLYLLMDIDIPWEYDPLREHPDKRKYLLEQYIQNLEKYGFNYQLISGLDEQRLKNAVLAVEDYLSNNQNDKTFMANEKSEK